ncbi:hypothetical protein ASD00_31320 [Ensifer sp. Root31]|uniref:maleylpyruvate isomerase family mycothiol-dependent enzyme n=1 Tax=Ensifer sp. Root31 TaxID=1736512 RepID=UPI00070A7F8D|nr:maleylpyruvate isomerase family mycothiol-dependent enzyme [Ensifer sp. Root31]KQU86382.1 hypothetical protein ASD00_31320 [Ensifer sp. Root31]
MSIDEEDNARSQLRARQGQGARYDAASAPHADLALVRRGTAYFARKLRDLADRDFHGPSLLPGRTRAHVVAEVGYRARAFARLVESTRTGNGTPIYESTSSRDEEITFGGTLPAGALRYLFDHAEVHLNVEWRDLGDAQWDQWATDDSGRPRCIRQTPWFRASEIWISAVDLDNGGSFLDFPADLTDRLLLQFATNAPFDVTLMPTDRSQPLVVGAGGSEIRGAAADLLRWLSGRGARRLDGVATVKATLWRHN